jgi:hypothetical protein
MFILSIHQTFIDTDFQTIVDTHVVRVIYAFAHLFSVVVCKFTPNSMVNWQFPNIASMEFSVT